VCTCAAVYRGRKRGSCSNAERRRLTALKELTRKTLVHEDNEPEKENEKERERERRREFA